MVSQLLEKYCAHAIYLADRFIEPSNSGKQKADIKEMLLDIFSHWNHNPQLIQLHELTGGITNMLLECSYPSADQSKPAEKVLVRTYGRGTNLIIDRDREFVSHLVLNSYNLAPPIHARFGNGLVYGFIEGRALQFEEMSDSHLYPFIASRLGEWHRLIDVDVIEESLRKLRRRFGKSGMLDSRSGKKPDNVWVLMKNWVEILPEISGMAHVCDENKDIQEVRRHNRTPTSVKEILSDELKWLKREIGDKSPLVAAHSDLLSGNIIMPSEFSDSLKDPQKADALVASYREKKVNPISFIDYEYMMPGPRAFDISNHFQEWQGFNCDKSLIPEPVKDNELLRTWCTSYLQTDDTKQVSSEVVDSLIEEISLYYGMPGFYWGIWAGIQSTISLIDFDYGGYSGERLVEYWNWKRAHLNKAANL
ncbi:DEKNAAC105251 [Brettanomyces naardenensis]|uniref:ethanolamine kinase n=1 Tax=Brettanomyces naardenensis TaxID=13370 RepID=A0A448YSY6_BRENA|nr:DEKNAAC105251 [Brettanomyces naardenensis]